MNLLKGKRVVVTGGTGSLGKVLIRRLLSGEVGLPSKVIVFSRDEAKQYFMRMEFMNKTAATDEILYRSFDEIIEFRIGDVREYSSIAPTLRDADVVINAAAMKQVPACEYFPHEAVRTNIGGAENIVRAIQEHSFPIETVVGISTDKACKPVNAMGMTKALQERIFIQGNMRCQSTRFVCVRYGNVLASRGSVIPLFHEQIRQGGPVTITTEDMTLFLLSLDDAVDTIFAALANAMPGEIFVPRAPAAKITDVASVLIGDRPISISVTGIRPGEKVHEIMVSDEEATRTVQCDRWYAVLPMLPELRRRSLNGSSLTKEYSSADTLMSMQEIRTMLREKDLMVEDAPPPPVFAAPREFLR